MSSPSTYKYAAVGILTLALFAALYFYVPAFFPSEYTFGSEDSQNKLAQVSKDLLNKDLSGKTGGETTVPTAPPFIVTHITPPKSVRSIYMTSCVVSLKSFRNDLVKIAETTEINSIVIDIKDFSGRISFKTENPILKPAVSDGCRADDMKEFIGSLHEKNIYVIGRITVFQDPLMTKAHPEQAVHKKSDGSVWKDYKGLSFIDVGSKEHWDYIVELSKESYALGFDELNFDYIRYPSDGNMKDIAFKLEPGQTKPQKLKEFFVYLHEKLLPIGVKTSADLFGMTTTNSDDLGIGQVLENALPYFDYVDPMVYPSHYPPNFHGYADPNKHPYEIVNYAMLGAVQKAKALDVAIASSTAAAGGKYNGNSVEKLRPWLQDFNYGGIYGPAEVRAQIKATYDAGLTSWMLWSPSNRYTLGALEK